MGSARTVATARRSISTPRTSAARLIQNHRGGSAPTNDKSACRRGEMDGALPEVYLVRHGETEWSASGRHTGRTDISLTPAGEEAARQLAARLEGLLFPALWSSPSQRAFNTSVL